jgi:hypothetical protein
MCGSDWFSRQSDLLHTETRTVRRVRPATGNGGRSTRRSTAGGVPSFILFAWTTVFSPRRDIVTFSSPPTQSTLLVVVPGPLRWRGRAICDTYGILLKKKEKKEDSETCSNEISLVCACVARVSCCVWHTHKRETWCTQLRKSVLRSPQSSCHRRACRSLTWLHGSRPPRGRQRASILPISVSSARTSNPPRPPLAVAAPSRLLYLLSHTDRPPLRTTARASSM